MKKALIIATVLHFLFAGSVGRSQRPSSSMNTMDTAMIRRITERMAFAWAREKAAEIDSVLMSDTSVIVGRVDEEYRPDGSVYAWIWQYRVTGRDTIYDTTIIKKVR